MDLFFVFFCCQQQQSLYLHAFYFLQALILPNHPQITRTPSSDSGVVTSGSLSADPSKSNPTSERETTQEFSNPPNAPPPTRRNLPQRPKESVHSSVKKSDRVEKTEQDQTKLKFLDSSELRRSAVKNIYDFERHVAVQNRQPRPTSMPCNPVMQPNYLRIMQANPDFVLEGQLYFELQRQQLEGEDQVDSAPSDKQSTYMNWPVCLETPPGVPPPAGVKDYIYENYAIAQQNFEEQRRIKNLSHNYVNVTLPSGSQAPAHVLARQQATEKSE